jgi:hypothetical protein
MGGGAYGQVYAIFNWFYALGMLGGACSFHCLPQLSLSLSLRYTSERFFTDSARRAGPLIGGALVDWLSFWAMLLVFAGACCFAFLGVRWLIPPDLTFSFFLSFFLYFCTTNSVMRLLRARGRCALVGTAKKLDPSLLASRFWQRSRLFVRIESATAANRVSATRKCRLATRPFKPLVIESTVEHRARFVPMSSRMFRPVLRLSRRRPKSIVSCRQFSSFPAVFADSRQAPPTASR